MCTSAQTYTPSPEDLDAVAARHRLGIVRRWRALAGGWSNPVLLLECQHGSAVLKVNTRYLDTPNVATEAAALAIASAGLVVAGAPFRVPQVIGADTGRTLLPVDYLLTEHLPGTNGGDVCKGGDVATRAELSHQLGEATRWLHAVRPPGERYGGWDPAQSAFGIDADWRRLTERRGQSLIPEASATGIIAPDVLEEIARWLDRHLGTVPHRPGRVLVHNDLTPWNTLVGLMEPSEGSGRGNSPDRRWRIKGIFDFEWSIAGPPAAELEGQLSGPAGLMDPTAFIDAYTSGTGLDDGFLREVLYYRMLHHLRTVIQFSRHWRQWGEWWIQERVEGARRLLHGQVPEAFAAAGYRWPF